jgi:hypothetical protein
MTLTFILIACAGAFIFALMFFATLGACISQRVLWAASLVLFLLTACWMAGFPGAAAPAQKNELLTDANERHLPDIDVGHPTNIDAGQPRVDFAIQARRIALEDFQYGGFTLGAARAAFLNRYPSAELDASPRDQSIGLLSYTVPLLGTFNFIDDELLMISTIYSSASVEAAGGLAVVKVAFEQKLGEPDSTEQNTSFWLDGKRIAVLSEERGALFFAGGSTRRGGLGNEFAPGPFFPLLFALLQMFVNGFQVIVEARGQLVLDSSDFIDNRIVHGFSTTTSNHRSRFRRAVKKSVASR